MGKHWWIFWLWIPNDEYAKYFKGQSYLNPLTQKWDCDLFLSNVTFEPWCRNNRHIHHATKWWGQILICVDLFWRYQEEWKDAKSLKAGDVVVILANIKSLLQQNFIQINLMNPRKLLKML